MTPIEKLLKQPYRTPSASSVRKREVEQLIEYTGAYRYLEAVAHGDITSELHVSLWQEALGRGPRR